LKKQHPKRQFAKKTIRAKLAKRLPPHPDDIKYEHEKRFVDLYGVKRKKYEPHVTPKEEKLYSQHRRGLLQFENYMEADHWSLNFGPCSFFIKGYKWPWHTKKDWRGLLFPTDAAVKKDEKFL